MALLQGMTITLYERHQTGVNAFNEPVFTEEAASVDGILICPASTEAIADGMQLYGKHTVYELLIPKADDHIWENRTVEFYGQKWRTFGTVLQWMEQLTPGPWNRKVRVERYG